MSKVSSNDVKTLNKFINETDEFKRYILCQLWITQQFTATINETITKSINSVKKGGLIPDNMSLDDSSIYNIFRDIKQKLIEENERLKLVVGNLQNSYDLMLVMDAVLGLDMVAVNNSMNDELEGLKNKIKNNEVYIDKINNLSESKITQIRNNNNNKTSCQEQSE